MDIKNKILQKTKSQFAFQGYDGVSMRNIAAACGITLSSIYYHFSSKDKLLEEIFLTTSSGLGKKRQLLSDVASATEMLRQRIEFQFNNAEDVVFILKYYLTFRKKFNLGKNGFLPPKTYLHIEEVLQRGSESGEFVLDDLHEDAQVIAHSINGFVLEYYPHKLTADEKEVLVKKIHRLLIRALTNHEK